MKKLFAILAILAMTLNATAQDVYSVGYYNANEGTRAALYKNSERLFTAFNPNQNSKATRVACTSQGDVFWLVNYYDNPSSTFSHSEIRLEDMVYASTENRDNIYINDLYCLNNTIYYAGYQYNEDSVMVATVWKGSDFTEHWILGDGVHASYIFDVDVDKQTGIPYFCGYVINDKKNAAVWEGQELLSIFEQDSIYEEPITLSFATQIAVGDSHYYTMGQFEQQGFPIPAIWRDNTLLTYTQPYFTDFHGICAFENTYYYGYSSRDQLYTSVLKSGQIEMLRLNSMSKMLSAASNIYVLGEDFDSHFCVWKNFEEQFQIEDCNAVYDMAVHETSAIPGDYYGYLYQPDSAVIYLDPNSFLGEDYDKLNYILSYTPSGLLEYSTIESYDMFGHWMHYYYNANLQIRAEYETYFYPEANPYQNYYTYENGLLATYARYFDNYHNDYLQLEDSITYNYDELGRLIIEKQWDLDYYNPYYRELYYEYNDREMVITTEGYSNGTSGNWIRLDKETRTFSADSLLLSQQNEPYNDSAKLVTYGYDEQGHRISALTQKRNNGVWENQKLVQYHFNPYGNLTLAEIKTWQENEWVDANRALYELDEMGYPAVVTFEKWDGETWVNGVWQADFYLYNEDHLKQQNDMLYRYRNSIQKIEMDYLVTENPKEPLLPGTSEWYYEIQNDDGSITYQHLQCVGDTLFDRAGKRPKVIVRSNTHYDRNEVTEVTHEYVYEENGIVYWWNKDLQEFTTLYDLNAHEGDEWEIKVGTDSITMHVDAEETIVYEGRPFRVLHVSDPQDLFSGDIVCGIGHLSSFFPEKLMNQGKGYRVTGLRCYWVHGNLVFKVIRDDCDAIYAEWHNGIEEDGPSTDSGTLSVYPNPTHGVLYVETRHGTSLPNQTYRITNLMGQTLMTGTMNAVETFPETSPKQIDISGLPAGMYFITVGEQTVKFVKQ